MSVPFSFIFIFFIVPFCALSVAIFNVAKRKSIEEKLFRKGILYLKNMRSLLMYIQQHRGLSNSYLNGNLKAEIDIERLEILIEKEIVDISAIEGWISINSKWESIVDHWGRIHARYKNIDAEMNLKQHNLLIANLLYFIDDLAYVHHLGQLGVIDATDTDWRNLLFMAEYIGQVRALGMGALTKGYCSSVLRIQLNHLKGKIASNINPNWAELIKSDFAHLLQIIEAQVMIDAPTITPAEYFTLATGCIEHVLLEFDRQVDKMQFHRK